MIGEGGEVEEIEPEGKTLTLVLLYLSSRVQASVLLNALRACPPRVPRDRRLPPSEG